MKTSLSHLPERHQSEILQICKKIKEIADPEKIILFGSYAKGNQVNHTSFDDGIRYQYFSDYDFLVIPKDRAIKEYVIQDQIVNIFRGFKTPISIIAHDINYVNEGLSESQYFFTDIVKEGILLHDSGNSTFVNARELTDAEKKEIAQRYFSKWYLSGNEFLIDAKNGLNRNSLNKGAFELHQATENYYNTVLLVSTGYKPKTHNLDKLRQYSKHISEELFAIFLTPENDPKEEHLFDLLKRGYIDARYKDDYYITADELMTLIEKVEKMQRLIQKICIAHISSFV
ncbi:MAG: HEPN domain-containing protein [Daejeonella sp.]